MMSLCGYTSNVYTQTKKSFYSIILIQVTMNLITVKWPYNTFDFFFTSKCSGNGFIYSRLKTKFIRYKVIYKQNDVYAIISPIDAILLYYIPIANNEILFYIYII